MEETDRRFMQRFLSDGELTRWLPVDYPCPLEQAHLHVDRRLEHWERFGFGTFVLVAADGADPVGYCGLEHVVETSFVDLRYGLIQDAQGQGLALEAAMRIMSHGFGELQLPRIYGAALPDNRASVAVLKKVGMRPDKRFDCYGSNLFTASIDRETFEQTVLVDVEQGP